MAAGGDSLDDAERSLSIISSPTPVSTSAPSREAAALSQGRSGHGNVCFQEVTVEVKHAKNKNPHKLLDNVSGVLYAGQMIALMGPSGSGKTTLLDVLSGRKSSGRITGSVLYDGQAPTKAFLRAATGYVEQAVTLVPVFTAREMLLYTAQLRRPWREARGVQEAIVDELMQQLQLTQCADVLIGDQLRKGLSGGQAKRVSIGVAMVCVPSVLYLDEPTSGLDSESAYEIMSLVRQTARDGTTVAMAIHAPSPELFAMFDSVLVFAQGCTIYSGGTGCLQRDLFKAAAGPWLDTETDMFAELLLKASSTATTRGEAKALAAAVHESCGSSSCESPMHIEATAYRLKESSAGSDPEPTTTSTPRAAACRLPAINPTWFQIYTLLKFQAKRSWLSPTWVLPRTLDKVVMALIMVSLFYGQGDNEGTEYVLNMTASLFMYAVIPSFGTWTYAGMLIMERPLYYREVADGLYGPFAYITFLALREIVLLAPVSLTYTPVIFWVIRYQGSFALFWLVYVMCAATSLLAGLATATISPNMEVATILVALYNLACFFSAGQIAGLSTLPIYWRWISRANFVRYAWTALVLNQYADTDPVFTVDNQTVLQWLNLSGNMWGYFGIITAFTVGFHILGWAGLTWMNHQKR